MSGARRIVAALALAVLAGGSACTIDVYLGPEGIDASVTTPDADDHADAQPAGDAPWPDAELNDVADAAPIFADAEPIVVDASP